MIRSIWAIRRNSAAPYLWQAYGRSGTAAVGLLCVSRLGKEQRLARADLATLPARAKGRCKILAGLNMGHEIQVKTLFHVIYKAIGVLTSKSERKGPCMLLKRYVKRIITFEIAGWRNRTRQQRNSERLGVT